MQAGKGAQRLPQREITETVTLSPDIGGKNYHYIIVPNVENEDKVNKKDGKPFFLRIFSSAPVDLVELPRTIEQTFTGEWKDKSAGGKRIIEITEETKQGKQTRMSENQTWCCNPQYFLNITKPTHLKITLKKRVAKRTKNKFCGITLTKAYAPTMPPATNEVGKNNQQGTVKIPSSLPLNGMTY